MKNPKWNKTVGCFVCFQVTTHHNNRDDDKRWCLHEWPLRKWGGVRISACKHSSIEHLLCVHCTSDKVDSKSETKALS